MSAAWQAKPPIAYVVSRFPMVSETFILRELEELRARGWPIVLIPLIHERGPVKHPEAEQWEERAWYTPWLSTGIVAANLRALLTRPRLYLGLWRLVLEETWGCRNYFLGAVGVLPKAVYLAEVLRRHGVRHVHAHFASHPAVAALVIERLAGISFSITAHAHDLYVHQHMLATKVRHARFVAAISDFNRAFIARYAGESAMEKTEVIRCGVDTIAITPSPLPTGQPFRVLSVASLQPYKGLSHLVRACALLKERRLDFECRIIGDGELRWSLERLIRDLHLEAQVRLLGPQPQQEVLRELGRAHVLALPSIQQPNGKMEGIPVALMEALAGGRPVVASRLSGIPELVRHEETGLLVEPGQPVALAEALERLARDPALAERLARAGRRLVEEEYDLRMNVGRLEQCFEMVLAEEARQSARFHEIVPA